MPRLACACQIMIFAREHHNFTGHTKVPERPKPLFALFQGDAEVIIRVKNQGWRFDIFRILERRAIPVEIKFLKEVATEIRFVAVRTNTSTLV